MSKISSKNVEVKGDVKTEIPEKVRVLSNRPGDIICPCGIVLKYQSAVQVSPETADWLLVSFPGFILKIA